MCPELQAVVIHTALMKGAFGIGWHVYCSCGWVSMIMGEGDAWTTKEHILTDKGHDAYVRTLTTGTG